MGKLTYADFNKEAVRTMQFANCAAWKLHHDYIDTEHLLLGLCLNLRCHASASVAPVCLAPQEIVPALSQLVPRGSAVATAGKRPVRPNAHRVTRHATEVASTLEARVVDNRHLLLGMLFTEGSIAFEVLGSIGVRYDDVVTCITRT